MTKIKDHVYIRNAIKEKSTRYGRLNLPFIIAVNVISIYYDDSAVMDALFGQEGRD